MCACCISHICYIKLVFIDCTVVIPIVDKIEED